MHGRRDYGHDHAQVRDDGYGYGCDAAHLEGQHRFASARCCATALKFAHPVRTLPSLGQAPVAQPNAKRFALGLCVQVCVSKRGA